MSTRLFDKCVECGARVVMAKVAGTTLAVAMDELDLDRPYWTLDRYERLVSGGALVEHACRPDVLKQFRSTWLNNSDFANEMNRLAYGRRCPKCGVEPGEGCLNLMERGRDVRTKSPHKERYPDSLDSEG